MRNPYAPHETHSQIVAETMWLQGALLGNIIYGVELTLYAICSKLLVQQTNRSNYRRQVAILAFITILFILGTLNMCSTAAMTQLSFIQNRDYPGGPAQYETDMFWIPVDELGLVAWVLGNWLADALLVWRCTVIFTGVSPIVFRIVMVVPCLFITGSVGLGLLFMAETSRSSPFKSVDISLPYFTTTLALNIIVTIMIVSRLLYCYRHFGRLLGTERVSYYASLAAILAESAALYSVFSFMFLLTLALDLSLSSIFSQTVGQVQIVSSFLIIFYVVTGRGWKPDNTTRNMRLPTPDAIQFRDIPSFTRVVSETKTRPRASPVAISMMDEVRGSEYGDSTV